MARFTRYEDAYEYARITADSRSAAFGRPHNMAIRATKEYGKLGYNVSSACINDSDYARAEIVPPGMPRTT